CVHAAILDRADAQRQLAEREVHANRELLKAVTDNSPAVIYVKGLDGRYLLINRRYEELFHVSREEMTGKTDYDLFSKESADAFRR
ncbi:PAS domain-containing protein, partial [Klebsiella pneumoniae]|uniref:PAS domain-containing protein n=1 Tax=Klebsiella pneumoniae TaxID=573 RepID=UPI0030133A83